VAVLEALEVREVPAIALIGTELRVTGSNLNDLVAITVGPRGSGQVTATRTEISTEGQTIESKTFSVSSVASVRVILGNGTSSRIKLVFPVGSLAVQVVIFLPVDLVRMNSMVWAAMTYSKGLMATT
jgi:hypothetical protein